MTHVVKKQIKCIHLSERQRDLSLVPIWWPNLPCLPEREWRARGIASTHCRPALWPNTTTLKKNITLAVRCNDCFVWINNWRIGICFYIPWQRKLAVIYLMITISENIWSVWRSLQTQFDPWISFGSLSLVLKGLSNWRIFRSLSAVTRFPFAPVFTCMRTFTEPVNIMKHMSAGIFQDFGIFFQIYSRVSRLSLLLFLNTRLSSFKYSTGPRFWLFDNFDIFSHNYCE